jgi:hypothetical protein
MGNMANEYKMLIGTHEGKRTHGSPRRTYEDNIKMDLKEI